ncbi:GTPase subunit of restriction endonuclease [Brachybacterium faecium DSM 4810]|uniref:GTPase subunit of restriction endonuclease n=1 Tax=Brachybacterium faecium (strain ATCC 43885 / DSM 4810 / JCM 11609 / LMG 19847 / NBRC 14762 / NCIMB 9860 / 6-10) TaxID=446465 RepID=C7MHK2_BRAFD|nr:AAA family ATPase [Brachybacterium faecium]ACU84411.1 GTPase subunit of restriction endonuclease [Brachybacterium faecium DSM 4810]HJG51119.1 AAA family ATPase [Brachybacterium faecium]
MSTMWGIHNDQIPAAELLAGQFVSIGWNEIDDVREIGNDQTALKAALAAANPDAKPGALPVWAGVLRRFAFEMSEGDLVVAPSKQAPVFNIGRIAGPYEHHPEVPEHRHRRPVEWLVTDVPRTAFTQSALYEMGAVMTLFRVTKHAEEFERVVENGVPAVAAAPERRTRVRHGLLQRTVLEVLRDRGSTPRHEIIKDVATRIELTGYETSRTAKGIPRFEVSITWGSVDMVAAGWILKTKRGWILTREGRDVLSKSTEADDLSKISGAAYKELRAAKRAQVGRFKTDRYPLIDEAVKLLEEGQWTTYSDIAAVVGSNPPSVGEYLLNRAIGIDGRYRVVPVGQPPYRDEDRAALEAEGVSFDDRGLPDPLKKVSTEDLRESMDLLGLLPGVPRRAWMVRGSSVAGQDLVPAWLDDGEVTLLTSRLRPVQFGASRDELKPIIDEDYAHASYDVRVEKMDDAHAFLTRMQEGHLVVTVDDGRVFVGTILEAARQRATTAGSSELVRDVEWADPGGVALSEISSTLSTRLKVQRDIVDLTQQIDLIEDLLDAEEENVPPAIVERAPLREASPELAEDLHVPQAWLQECIDLLDDRPQLIFYGPPGTGKTFLAQAIAKHIAGENVRLVQFHPAYSYEDFFEGYRPQEGGGFTLKPGPLRKVVSQAKENPQDAHVLIIDEINRGNLAKVFGELYFLLEYRTENVELLYADEEFNLPENVFIIGTMNTADRSIALVDAAMRRRFSFLPLHPSEEPTNRILRSWLSAEGRPRRVADLLDELNRRIDDPDFKIGPSYFMRSAVHREGGLERTWRTSILPLLEEHHFGEMDARAVRTRYGLEAVSAAVDRTEDPTDAPSRTH